MLPKDPAKPSDSMSEEELIALLILFWGLQVLKDYEEGDTDAHAALILGPSAI